MLRSIAPLLLALPCLLSGAGAQSQDFLPTEECPLLGSEFPTDFDIEQTDAFAEAKEAFPKVIQNIFDLGIVNGSISSFYIDVFSATTNKTIYSYSHQALAPAVNETFPAGGIDDETIFRVGSVSKLFTVYAILAKAGNLEILDHPVTRYLPELAGNSRDDPLNKIIWEDVKVGTLAAHQAGVGQFPYTLACVTPDDPVCNPTDFLDYYKNVRQPTQAIHRSSLYADGGFGILGLVLDRITGRRYGDAVLNVLGEPLNWNGTSSIIPEGEDVNGIIIPITNVQSSGWGYDNQITAPSGGIYSNAADLRALGTSILQSKFLSPSDTRLWMKPRAHVASLTASIGAPWEIYRLTLPVSVNSTRYRVSDLYTKAGGNPGYTAIHALSPDHNIGYTVLVAGATAGGDRWPLRAAVGEVFITAAEHAGHEVAKRRLTGTFASESDPTTNLTFTVENGHPGIGLPTFFIGGLDAKLNMSMPGLTELPPGVEQVIRLYPTGLEDLTENGCKKIKFRAVIESTPWPPRAKIEGGSSLFEDGCTGWLNTAFFEGANGEFFDGFILEVDQEGSLIGVEYPAWDLKLKKVTE